MKKKRLIAVASILVIVILLIVLSSTVFSLNKVTISFYDSTDAAITDYTTLNHFEEEDFSEIISSGKFKKGQSIFTIKKSKHIDNLEKTNPYLKVISIEIKFPNGINIKAIEREEFYYIQSDTTYYVCDGDLKVLRTTSDPATLTGLIEWKGLTADSDVTLSALETGEFFTGGIFQQLSDVKNCLLVSYFTHESALEKFASFELVKTPTVGGGSEYNLKMQCVEGGSNTFLIEIKNIENNMEDKIFKARTAYKRLTEDTNPPETSGNIVVLDDLKVYFNEGEI